jgi:hypothetical protein
MTQQITLEITSAQPALSLVFGQTATQQATIQTTPAIPVQVTKYQAPIELLFTETPADLAELAAVAAGNPGTPGADARPPGPSFTYTAGVLTRIDYTDGTYKLLDYVNGALSTLRFFQGLKVTTKTFVRDLAGSLTRIDETTV